MPEKLTRLRADTFRARLRLGLGFDSPIHVPHDLTVCDGDIEHLCDAICVDGKLNLSGCVNLEALPERLVVRGELVITDCGKITRLPGTVRELFGLRASGCSALESIEPLARCHGELDLRGCEAMGAISSDFKAVGLVKLDGLRIDEDTIFVKGSLPDVVKQASIGKKVGEVVSHRVLGDHPILNAVITDAGDMELWESVRFRADTSDLIIPRKRD